MSVYALFQYYFTMPLIAINVKLFLSKKRPSALSIA